MQATGDTSGDAGRNGPREARRILYPLQFRLQPDSPKPNFRAATLVAARADTQTGIR